MATEQEIETATRELTRYILNDVFVKYYFSPEDTMTIVTSVLMALIATRDDWGKLGNGVS